MYTEKSRGPITVSWGNPFLFKWGRLNFYNLKIVHLQTNYQQIYKKIMTFVSMTKILVLIPQLIWKEMMFMGKKKLIFSPPNCISVCIPYTYFANFASSHIF